MAENKMSVADLKVALAEAKAEERAVRHANAMERRRKEAAAQEARVNAFRESEVEASVGDYREWLGLNVSYNGGLELINYEGTSVHSSISLSAEDARALRDHLNTLLG